MTENNQPIESDRRLVTVMFADISGFTAMSEKMDPEEVACVMNDCYCMMGECVEEFGGTVDKFMGDCVMALFGAPRALEDAPHRALNSALEIRKRIQRFNEDKNLTVPLSFHIGINTGPVIAGMMGSERKQDFTVLGDAVNLASRMESEAKTGDILVTEFTHRLTQGYFDFEDLGPVKVKGKDQPVRSYRLLGTRKVKTRVEAALGKGLSPFTGRAREILYLTDCYEKAKEGQGQVVGVMGEPGMGKTRLVREFIQGLPAEEFIRLEGGCLHFGDAIPYLPILDLLREYFGIKDDDNEVSIKEKISSRVNLLTGQITGILSPLLEVLSVKVEDEEYLKLDAKRRRDRVYEAIRLFLLAESMKKPLVMVIEDLHWIDKTSEEFLNYLIEHVPATRILLILLFRPEYIPSWVGKTFYSQVRVDQLARKTSADLVQGILEGCPVAPELGEFIARRTEGNPLFIEEMTRNLLESGSISKEGQKYVLSQDPSDIQVPATIQGIIAARLDKLEGTLRSVIQMASVIGREFAFRILQTITTLREDLKSCLSTLQGLEFIYEKAFLPELEYIFKHALTQEVAYNSLLIRKRRETHGKVGQAIEQIYAERLEEFYEILAYHYSLSENTLKAYQYLRSSGDKAARNYANTEAVRYYREALRVLDSQPEEDDGKKNKFMLLMKLFEMMNFFGYPEGSLQYLLEAEKLARELNDDKLLAGAYGTLTYYHTQKGNLALSTEYSAKSFQLAEKNQNINQIIKIGGAVCSMYWTFGDYTSAAEIGLKSIKTQEDNGKLNLVQSGLYTYSNICAYCDCALGFLGRIEEGKQLFDKALVHASDVNDKLGIAFLEFMHSGVSYWEGDGSSTYDHAILALKSFDESGAKALEGMSWIMSGLGNYLLGKYKISRENAEKGMEIQKRIEIQFVIAWCHWYVAIICFFTGDLDNAREHAELALRLSRETSARPCEGISWILTGCLEGKKEPGRFIEAQENILHGIRMLEEMKARALLAFGHLLLGEFLADFDRRDEAIEHLKKAESMYLEMNVTPKSHWLARTRDDLAKL